MVPRRIFNESYINKNVPMLYTIDNDTSIRFWMSG